jgi:hypothetical protein
MDARARFGGILLAGFAALAMSSLKAPARVVCNTTGECWHVQSDFPPSDALTYHPDDWQGKDGERYSWRDEESRADLPGGQLHNFDGVAP